MDTPNIKSNPLAWTMAVNANALERREAYPPRKSLMPQTKTAPRLKKAGRNCGDGTMSMNEVLEINTVRWRTIWRLRGSGGGCGYGNFGGQLLKKLMQER